MDYGRRLIGNVTVLNVILAVALFFAIRYAVYPFFGVSVAVPLRAASAKPAPQANGQVSAASRSPLDFAVIADRNLFHPERKIPPEKVEKDKVKELPKPDLVLYGTIITDEKSIAYVEDTKAPYSTPGRGKRQVVLKKGDNVSGFVLKEIEPTHIVLLRGSERLVVNLDMKDRLRGGEPAAAAVRTRADMPALLPATNPASGIRPATAGTIRPGAPAQPVAGAITPQAPTPREQLERAVIGGRRQMRNPLTYRK